MKFWTVSQSGHSGLDIKEKTNMPMKGEMIAVLYELGWKLRHKVNCCRANSIDVGSVVACVVLR